MTYENELAMFVLCFLGFIVILLDWKALNKLYQFPILFSAYAIFFIGTAATNLESYFYPRFLNILEHICYLLSILITGIWLMFFIRSTRKSK